MARKKKYRYRKTKKENTKIGNILVTNRKLSDFRSVRPAVKYLLSIDKKYKAVVSALNEQMPGFFTDAEYNANLVDLDRNKDELVDFITGRLKAAQDIYRQRGKEPTITQLITKEFRTETYLSREDRILMNLEKRYSKRESFKIHITGSDKDISKSRYKFIQERNLFKEKLDTTDLTKLNLVYLDRLPSNMPRSTNSQNRGYLLTSKDTKNNNQVLIELIRVQKETGEYEEEMIIRYLDNGKWETL